MISDPTFCTFTKWSANLNVLYGWAMSQRLPTHGFKWMKDLTIEKVLKIVNGNITIWGYIFDVDLEYPQELWDSHNDYPLAPEKIKTGNVEKLVGTFLPKNHYVLHYKNLRQYLSLGMKLKRVHRGISFYQSDWMKPYITKNTELRKQAKNAFEKDYFKLLNNSVFGKIIENIRIRQNVELIEDREKVNKLSSRPNFDRATIFDENLVAIHLKKTEVYFNKPIYVGQAILDLSKTFMFDFNYCYIKEKYGDRAKLLFTDTDSLMYEIETEDFFKDISKDVKKKFDTSDYPEKHDSGIKTRVNKKVIGKFKDEVVGKQITHFVGLRSKLYCYKIAEKDQKKCKGVKKSVIKKTISFEDYKRCLFSEKQELRDKNMIRSNCHDIYSMTVNKVALSSNDDKRKICENKVNTLAKR